MAEDDLVAEFAAIAAEIEAWDGRDLRDLRTAIHRYNHNRTVRSGCDIEWADDQSGLSIAINNIAMTQTWPAPWDTEHCEFALLVDQSGQYLSVADSNFEPWEIHRWEGGASSAA